MDKFKKTESSILRPFEYLYFTAIIIFSLLKYPNDISIYGINSSINNLNQWIYSDMQNVFYIDNPELRESQVYIASGKIRTIIETLKDLKTYNLSNDLEVEINKVLEQYALIKDDLEKVVDAYISEAQNTPLYNSQYRPSFTKEEMDTLVDNIWYLIAKVKMSEEVRGQSLSDDLIKNTGIILFMIGISWGFINFAKSRQLKNLLDDE